MMSVDWNSPVDVRAAGMQALANALGPVGAARFIQQLAKGYGDYTKEKYEKPALSFAEIQAKIQQKRSA